jgi:DNA-binding response OmpR family regulator
MTTRNILIVDDEPKVAFFLGQALERSNQGYHVTIAHSGEEALEVLDGSPVDLLVTDLRLPGISGLELMRWVRASSPQTHTILITAYGNDEVEAEVRQMGAYRYITKPFDIGDFTRVVQEALRDVVTSRPGLVALSSESFEAIAQQLESLHYDIGARCIFLADMQGQRLAEAGDTEGLDTATLLALLAGGFATSGELARQFGGGEAANLNFHESPRYEIYSANVGDDLFLAIVYDRRVQTSRIGIVWLYTRRTIKHLLATLSTVETAAPAQSLDADFGSSLTAELDTLFTESPHPNPLPRREGEPLPGLPLAGEGERTEATGVGQFSPVEPGEPAMSNGEGSAPGGPPPGGADKEKHSDGEEPERELLDMEAAIARGLIPADMDFG